MYTLANIKDDFKNNRTVRHIYYYCRGFLKSDVLKEKAREAIKDFNVYYPDLAMQEKVIDDMIRMNKLYGYMFDEYLFFHFENRDIEDRRKFVAEWEHLSFAAALNSHNNDNIFDNKWKTYQTFKKHYKRDVLLCDHKAVKKFIGFCDRYSEFIVKPLNLSCGSGIQIIRNIDTETDKRSLFDNLIKKYHGTFLVEELIYQINEMAKFHPASVNTVRVPTIRTKDDIIIYRPFMRMGQHGSCVDNAGAGGIIATCDAETGKIYAAADEFGKSYEIHPETHEEIIGFVVPRWKEARIFVKELAMVLHDNRYTSWDIALTESGWVLVEANRRGQFLWQIPTQAGCRDELNVFLKNS